jgi:hypothetical protein
MSQYTYEEESCRKVPQDEPRPKLVQHIVQVLRRKCHLSVNAMVGPPNLTNVGHSIETCKQGSVQPTTTLREEFRDRVGNVGFGVGSGLVE